MKIGIAIFRRLLLLAAIALCLIYVNGAVYRAWLAGGPPMPNPEGLLFSAGNYLSWALAFLSAGIGLFLLIGSLPALSKVAFAFLFLSGVLAVTPSVREFVAKDSCLDAGGKWSTRELRCAYE
jgi:hypothetical protein